MMAAWALERRRMKEERREKAEEGGVGTPPNEGGKGEREGKARALRAQGLNVKASGSWA